MRRATCVVAMLALIGCAAPAYKNTTGILSADQAMVGGCEYLGEVDGTSIWGGPLGDQRGYSKARYDAMVKAKDLGGTHVVWYAAAQRGLSEAHGRAYRCAGVVAP